MTRFMAPRYFEQDQHDAVVECLRQLNIDDEEGIRIFIIALEYELAEYEKFPSQPIEAVPPPSSDEILMALAAAADSFRQILTELSENGQTLLLKRLAEGDQFARQYDARYLSAVLNQVTRIATACQADRQPAARPPAGPSQAGKRFIALVAEAYSECFEIDPAAEACRPFAQLLERVIEICSLAIEITPQDLLQIVTNRARIGAAE